MLPAQALNVYIALLERQQLLQGGLGGGPRGSGLGSASAPDQAPGGSAEQASVIGAIVPHMRALAAELATDASARGAVLVRAHALLSPNLARSSPWSLGSRVISGEICPLHPPLACCFSRILRTGTLQGCMQ
jgi:hypothetical protein